MNRCASHGVNGARGTLPRALSRVPRLAAAAALTGLLAACAEGAAPAAPPITPPPIVPPAVSGPVGPLVVGQTYVDPSGYIEYVPGDAPLVIVAPHGGTLSPSGLPDRSCAGCTTTNDLNTQELARTLVEEFRQRTGARPHLIVNRLHRRKFDGNRDLAEATGGTASLNTSWTWLHAAIDSAKAGVARRHARGLVIDLHGHAHPIARLELGYLLGDAELRASDATLAAGGAMSRSSVARLAADTRTVDDRGVALLRGPRSLGALLGGEGIRSVPSPTDPAPLIGEEYFNGGYNTQRHGSLAGGSLDAIQIECHLAGIRDTETNRVAFAKALTTALRTYFMAHYGWTGPAS